MQYFETIELSNQNELLNCEDEDELCRIADEVELLSGDKEWLSTWTNMNSLPTQTLQVDQFDQGKPTVKSAPTRWQSAHTRRQPTPTQR